MCSKNSWLMNGNKSLFYKLFNELFAVTTVTRETCNSLRSSNIFCISIYLMRFTSKNGLSKLMLAVFFTRNHPTFERMNTPGEYRERCRRSVSTWSMSKKFLVVVIERSHEASLPLAILFSVSNNVSCHSEFVTKFHEITLLQQNDS